MKPTTLVVVARTEKKAERTVDALKQVRIDGEEIRVLTPAADRDDRIRVGARAAGVVLCGGPDLEPWRYGEEPLPGANLSLRPELDQLEYDVLEGARDAATPVWAICRGMQTLNVFLGGTLWQDLPTQVPGTDDHYVREPLDHLAHGIDVTDRSTPFGELLAAAETKDPESTRVNTRHHQAVKDLAPGLHAVASSPDGVLEVLEGRDGAWWLRGVQWHPEDLLALPLQRRLWRDFVEQALAAPS